VSLGAFRFVFLPPQGDADLNEALEANNMTPAYPKSGYRTSPPTGIVREGESPQVRLRHVITEGPAILYACEPSGDYARTLVTITPEHW
jgi:hypothetical protein